LTRHIIPKGQREENTMKTVGKKLLGLLVTLTTLLLAACSQAPTPTDALEPQIVGGTVATAGEYPWMAQLKFRGRFSCGGSLVARSWVLTAAHCVNGRSAGDLQIILGDHRRSVVEGTEQTLNVSSVVVHPSFNAMTFNNDLALLQLASPATLNARVGLVELGTASLPGTPLRVIGWGTTAEGGVSSDVLRKVTVPRVSSAGCDTAYPGRITGSMFCAGLPEGLKDSCQGDSGGPIFLPTSRRLVGLVSWGTGCARPGLYGVYTNLSGFTPWINSYIRPLIILDFDLCIYQPGLCAGIDVDLFPDPCIYCTFNLNIPWEEMYQIQFGLPELGLKPDEFAQAFAFKILTPQGKLIATAKSNGQEPLLELTTLLPKGNYRLQVDILDPSVAKVIQANGDKYLFKFRFSLTK
jgi:Trypsin